MTVDLDALVEEMGVDWEIEIIQTSKNTYQVNFFDASFFPREYCTSADVSVPTIWDVINGLNDVCYNIKVDALRRILTNEF